MVLLLLFVACKMESKSKQYKQQNTWINERYVTIGTKMPKEFVQQFKDACKVLGVSQSEVFKKAMENTINLAKK